MHCRLVIPLLMRQVGGGTMSMLTNAGNILKFRKHRISSLSEICCQRFVLKYYCRLCKAAGNS